MGDFLPFHSYHSKKQKKLMELGHPSWQKSGIELDKGTILLFLLNLFCKESWSSSPSFLREDMFIARVST